MSETTPPGHPQNYIHLFLRDAPRFFVSFLNALENYFPAVKGELDEIKQRAINQLKQIYTAEQLEHWRKEGLERTKAFLEWSSAQELQRQIQTITLLKESLYDALVEVEMEIAVERNLSYDEVDMLNEAIQQIHQSIIVGSRDKKLEEYSQSGHFEIKSNCIVNTEDQPGERLDITLKLSQYGDPYIPVYTPSQNPADFSPINALVDEITIKTSDGQTLSWKKLRSAFFDCHYAQMQHHLIRFSDEELAEDRQYLNSLSKQKLKSHVEALIQRQDPLSLQRFVDVLSWDSNKFGPPSEPLERYIKKESKYKKELENLLNEQKVIIPYDKDCITQYVNTIHPDSPGFSIPPPVLEVFQKHGSLKGNGWAMTSLLLAYNIFAADTLNKFIAAKARKAGFITTLYEQMETWRENHINSLDSLYRELIAFKEVGANKNFTPCLFFHIPIQFKKGHQAMHLGLKKVTYFIGPHLIYSSHDLHRSRVIAEETNRNYKNVLKLTDEAIQLLEQEDQRTQDPSKKNLLKRYKTTLRCLLEQIFQTDPQTQITSLKAVDQAETLARLSMLLQMLNIKVNVHDFNGMDLLMKWSAKCNQLLACLAVSKDGSIPDVDVTSRTLDPTTYDPRTRHFNSHWSFDVFLRTFPLNVELQKARKGFASAVFFKTLNNEALARALTVGAFDLMERFKLEEMNKARLRVK